MAVGSLAELALAVVVARRAVLERRAAWPRPDNDFEIILCSPCPGGHDDDRRGPRDLSRGYRLCLTVVDEPPRPA